MATILITGATGTVGSEVARRLESQPGGHVVLKASSRPRGGEGWVVFDFLRPETFGVLSEVDRVFFVRPPALASERHFRAFLDALAASSRLEAVVFLSLQGVESMPWVPHAHLEKALVARRLPWTFLRPSFFLQNLCDTHGAEIRETGSLTLPAGDGRTAFIDTRDIAEVAANVLSQPETHRHRAYTLTGTESLAYTEVMTQLSRAAERSLSYRSVGFFRFYWHGRQRGFARGMTLVMCLLYGLCRFGQAAQLSPELAILLGRPPRRLSEFAQEHAHVWR